MTYTKNPRILGKPSAIALGAFSALSTLAIAATLLFGQDKTQFQEGFDGVQVAPNNHKVLFENAFVRVLELSLPPGTKEPMHHHRWPSIFLKLDSGGRTAHIRYYRSDGSVQDYPSHDTPVIDPPVWRVSWMEPEPLHAVENAETVESAAKLPRRPHTVRVEFKIRP